MLRWFFTSKKLVPRDEPLVVDSAGFLDAGEIVVPTPGQTFPPSDPRAGAPVYTIPDIHLTAFQRAIVSQLKVEFPYLAITRNSEQLMVVHRKAAALLRDHGLRFVDIQRSLPIIVELVFLPDAADVRALDVANSGSAHDRVRDHRAFRIQRWWQRFVPLGLEAQVGRPSPV